MRPILFTQIGDTNKSQFEVYAVDGDTSELLFSYGNAASYTIANGQCNVNLAIHFNGAIYAIAPCDGIYRWRPGEAAAKIHSFTSAPAAGSDASRGLVGFFPVWKSGKSQICCGYATTTNDRMIFVFVDSYENTSETSELAASDSNDRYRTGYGAMLHNGSLYFGRPTTSFNDNKLYRFEPETETISSIPYTTSINSAFGSAAGLALAEQSGRLYGTHVGGGSPAGVLYEIQGTTIIPRGTWSVTANITAYYTQHCLFSYENTLYCAGWAYRNTTGSNLDRWEIWRLDQDSAGDLVAATEVTDTVFGLPNEPVEIDYSRWEVIFDIESDGTRTPIILMSIYLSPWQMYKFNGSDQPATYLGTFGDNPQFMPSSDGIGGGQYTFGGSGELNWSLVGARIVNDNIEIDQVISGSPGSGTVSFDFAYRAEVTGISPLIQATLIATTSGTLTNNVVQGIIPEGTGSIITTTWAAASDGVVNGQVPPATARLYRA